MAKKSSTGLLIGAGAAALALIALSSSESAPKAQETVKETALKVSGKPVDFIIANLPYARAANKVYPQIPVEVFLSFSGLESGWGKNAPKFNFFGTKPGKGYTGMKQLFKTSEILPKAAGYNFPKVYSITKRPDGKYRWVVDDYFRAFNSPLEAYLDFGKFVTSGRYKKAFGTVYSVPEIVAKIRKVWEAGYATDPGYVGKHEKIVTLIKEVINKFGK